MNSKLQHGPQWDAAGGVDFRVWAPFQEKIVVRYPQTKRELALVRDDEGWHTGTDPVAQSGDQYILVLDGGKERPDPAARRLPRGVHGPAEIPSSESFAWSDMAWHGINKQDYVISEIHVGTATPEGTFSALSAKLPYFKECGFTALELLPLAAFPGRHNWGYDGVGLYAPHTAYGTPDDLRRLVDTAHNLGLAVGLDVVYNHLGPEGNYLRDFGPYFTEQYHTPWGAALHLEGAGSQPVREFLIGNAEYWTTQFHFDFFRLDATHELIDRGARPFLRELVQRIKATGAAQGRRVHVFAENDRNDPSLLLPSENGGMGLDGVWADELHHTLHVRLTGENSGYYSPFKPSHLAKALRQFFVVDGPERGASPLGLRAGGFITCLQNHDQIGNRARGDRLNTQISSAEHRLALGLVLLSPGTPLVFMGEESSETRPFLYFVDHTDQCLRQAVSQGRRKEFAAFGWTDVPDPAEEKTFLASKLDWNLTPDRKDFLEYFKAVVQLRKSWSWLGGLRVGEWNVQSFHDDQVFALDYPGNALILANFSTESLPLPPLTSLARLEPVLTSSADSWATVPSRAGEIPPLGLVVYT